MLRKMFSLGALVVVAVTFGVGNAAAKSDNPGKSGKPKADHALSTEGFSNGQGFPGREGLSDGRI